MEEELKTLKDLNKQDFGNGWNNFIDQRELKQEAIKWIKERMFLPIPKGVISAHHHAYMRGEREFIKHFFNITEEDLKDG